MSAFTTLLSNIQEVTFLEESFEDAKSMAERMGFKFIDHETVGDWDVGIFEGTIGMSRSMGLGDEGFYQISLNRVNYNFLTDQGKTGIPVSKDFVRSFRGVEEQLKYWLRTYDDKPHYVGSHNEKKTKSYKRMLDRFSDIKTGEIVGFSFKITN